MLKIDIIGVLESAKLNSNNCPLFALDFTTDAGAVIHSDGWRGYDGLVDIGFNKHFRVHHGESEFANGESRHFNGIESFWRYVKRRLAKFNGVAKHTFYLHSKETEFSFNHRRDTLCLELLKL